MPTMVFTYNESELLKNTGEFGNRSRERMRTRKFGSSEQETENAVQAV